VCYYADGNWSCTLPSDLPAGDHFVTVAITNPDGSTEQLGPYAVTVSSSSPAGITISSNTPLAPSTGYERVSGAMAGGLFLLIGAFISGGVLVTTAMRYRRAKRTT
jgi:hypothetical protein